MGTLIRTEPFVVREPGEEGSAVLFSPDDASRMRGVILDRLQSLPSGSLLPLDFSGARVCSEAARELLKTPLLRVIRGELADRFVMLVGLDVSRYNIEIMLKHEDLVVAERRTDGEMGLIGRVDPAVVETYRFMMTREITTARDVYEHFELSNLSAATNRLTTLTRLALARRVGEEPVGRGGRRHLYVPVM